MQLPPSFSHTSSSYAESNLDAKLPANLLATWRTEEWKANQTLGRFPALEASVARALGVDPEQQTTYGTLEGLFSIVNSEQVAIVEMGAYPGVTSTVGGTLFIEQASGQPMISVRGFLTGLEASVAAGGWHIHTGAQIREGCPVESGSFPAPLRLCFMPSLPLRTAHSYSSCRGVGGTCAQGTRARLPRLPVPSAAITIHPARQTRGMSSRTLRIQTASHRLISSPRQGRRVHPAAAAVGLSHSS